MGRWVRTRGRCTRARVEDVQATVAVVAVVMLGVVAKVGDYSVTAAVAPAARVSTFDGRDEWPGLQRRCDGARVGRDDAKVGGAAARDTRRSHAVIRVGCGTEHSHSSRGEKSLQINLASASSTAAPAGS